MRGIVPTSPLRDLARDNSHNWHLVMPSGTSSFCERNVERSEGKLGKYHLDMEICMMIDGPLRIVAM